MVLPSKYIKEKGEDFFLLNHVGTGPYKFKEQMEGSYILFEALPNHWRVGVPKYQQILFMNVPEESTRIAVLKTGHADVISISPERLKDVEAFNTFSKTGSAQAGPWLNNQWDPKTFLGGATGRDSPQQPKGTGVR